jgi:hypothetical protein
MQYSRMGWPDYSPCLHPTIKFGPALHAVQWGHELVLYTYTPIFVILLKVN